MHTGIEEAFEGHGLAGQVTRHSLDDARVFVVYPADDTRGLVRVEGRWSPAAELGRT